MDSSGPERTMNTPNRNEPCPCGSGKKYKKCCLPKSGGVRHVSAPSAKQRLELAAEHHRAGRLAEARAIYEALLQDDPQMADALHLSGMVALETGDVGLAIALIGRAIEINPNAVYYSNQGNAFKVRGDFGAAQDCYRKSLALDPRNAGAHNNLGVALQEQGRIDEAIACYNAVLEIEGADRNSVAQACISISAILGLCDRRLEALGYALRAAEVNPDSAEAHQSVAALLGKLSDYGEVCAECDAALALKPDDYAIWASRLFHYSYHPDLSAEAIVGEFVRWGDRFPALSQFSFADHDRATGRRLRVGYVSPDLCRHSTRFFFTPLFSHHDRSRFELYAYANVSQGREDKFTDEYRGMFDHWRDIRGVCDDDAAALIYRDGIDILVDCSGHTLDDRLGVFARKPAPVQATWLGTAWTTGLKTVDYVFLDSYLAPEGTLAREKIVRLPSCFVAYRPPEETAEVVPAPVLKNGYITFGYSGRTERLNHRVFRAWGEILRRSPDARLILDYTPFADPPTQGYYREFQSAHGVDVSRVTMRCSANIFEGLGDIDILLDGFPHNSGTTLFDALWMGVPALTLAGRPPVGRIGSSLMMNLGLPQWVTYSEAEYVERAVDLARDTAGLAAIRAGMRERMRNSPLMDEVGFARNFEDALRGMWQTWCEETQ